MASKQKASPTILENYSTSALEKLLTSTKSADERRRVFRELLGRYAEPLYSDALKWAKARHMIDPKNDGPQAVSRAFVLLASTLDQIDFGQKSLLYRFKGAIWSELGHIRNERILRLKRTAVIDQTVEKSTDLRERYQERLEAEQELTLLSHLADTPAQRRLFLAWKLKASGYSWNEIKNKLEWEGSPESLRTSVSRLKTEILERARTHIHR